MSMSENSQSVQKITKQDANPPDVPNPTEDGPGLKHNPLMMSVVLRCVFDKIGDVRHLKSFRLVNSTWNEAAIYRLNKLCRTVTFGNPYQLEALKSCIAASNSDTNRWRFPLTKFRILPITTKTGDKYFLPLIAPWVTDIILFSTSFNYPESYSLAKPSPLDNLEFPSLKSLNVSIHVFLSDDSDSEFFRRRQLSLSLVTKILQNSSNLEHLIIHEGDKRYVTDQIKDHVPMTNQILDTMETKPNAKLRVLKFNAAVENSHFRRLTDLQLNLTYLRLDFESNEHQINPEILRDFLQTQSKTLVKLRLRNLGKSWIKEVLFPNKMEKLKFIEIGIFLLSSRLLKPVTFPGLNINKQMPVLTEIKFRDYTNAGWMEFFSYHLTNQPVTSVKRVRFWKFFPTFPIIESGMKCFPNAKYSLC